MKETLLTVMLLAASSAFAQNFSVGVGIGAPGYYPPAGVYGAPCGPGYVWIDGYNDVNGYWVNGYCAVPPYGDDYWVAPGYFGGRWVGGYWGRRGWDRDDFRFRGGDRGDFRFRGGDRDGFRGGFSNGFGSPRVAPNNNFRGGNPNFRGGGGHMNGGGFSGNGGGHGGRR